MDRDGLQWVALTFGIVGLAYLAMIAVVVIFASIVIGLVAGVLALVGGIKGWIALTNNNPRLALMTVGLTIFTFGLLYIKWIMPETAPGVHHLLYSPFIEAPLIITVLLAPWICGAVCLGMPMDDFEGIGPAFCVGLFTVTVLIAGLVFNMAISRDHSANQAANRIKNLREAHWPTHAGDRPSGLLKDLGYPGVPDWSACSHGYCVISFGDQEEEVRVVKLVKGKWQDVATFSPDGYDSPAGVLEEELPPEYVPYILARGLPKGQADKLLASK